MQIAEALKNLYMKVTGAKTAPVTDQIADIIQAIADDYPETSGGDSGSETQ